MSDKWAPAARVPPGSLRITMIRCATVLLSYEGHHLLTDPWFGMHMRGLPVRRRPGRTPSQLPPLTAVLVSHLHPDHFEPAALAELSPPPEFVVLPPGAKRALAGVLRLPGRIGSLLPLPGGRQGLPPVNCRPARHPVEPQKIELCPWSEIQVGPFTVTAIPARHTGPPPDEINFVVELPGWGRLLFGGDARLDTALLGEVRRRFGPVRLALLPVGGTQICGVRTVMDPADAETATLLLEAERVIPLHEGGLWWSLPPLSRHPGRNSDLKARFARRGCPERVVVLGEGDEVEL